MINSPKYNKPVFKLNQPDDSYKAQPLPQPSGKYPYHLALQDILPAISPASMAFHIAGDTGNLRAFSYQTLVAAGMVQQCEQSSPQQSQPCFLYHLGDVVYNHGEAFEYERQFFQPFKNYPGPIFAIAGNHDSDVNPDAETPYNSLDAFRTVFCDTLSREVAFNTTNRKSITQPNVYWVLDTPLATIIGLYSNVPKYGFIDARQRAWFIDQLKAAASKRPDKALLVCIHHSPYSADVNHSSSLTMIDFLESAYQEANVKPDIVFSGHVHNYQRLCKHYPDGSTVPYIVAGAGGYDELHAIADTDDIRFNGDSPRLDQVDLLSYCDTKHGFLKVNLEKTPSGVSITTEYYTVPDELHEGEPLTVTLVDSFTKVIEKIEAG
ncbi:metallophosphoesterase family protein [Mucilaginibacter paludis]|uniref:Metallophosphoesterase n=1 Tax=Mucilaginibacter paludis DSM 18603 TaxID=714943 RepID=H1Y764_9SPHI|nr:metallophosphoesterase [Mucilaginibacter paludis]EHQ28683.1 metallophosphoesterase [Mucilaginibacter paludis DSM 18603]